MKCICINICICLIMWAQVLVTALAFKQSRAQQNLSDRNKTGLSRPDTWATATSKKIHDFGRVSFPSFASRGYQGGSARRLALLVITRQPFDSLQCTKFQNTVLVPLNVNPVFYSIITMKFIVFSYQKWYLCVYLERF